MSFINFLDLTDSKYGNYAKGILYVICEVFSKIIYAVGNLIDVITGLFYKLAGANYLGSGSETLVEEQDLMSQLFNQNIVSKVSLFMIIISFSLMAIFGLSAVMRKMFSNKEDKSSMVDVIKNMILGFIFLICLGPIAMFAISSISTIASAIISIFGDTSSVSLADLIFNSSFGGSGSPIEAYNAIFTTEITSWTEMKENFVFEFMYGDVVTGVEFYWYIYLLGSGVVLYNLLLMVFRLVKRIFNIIILYLTAPVYVAKMVDDGGVKFKEWKNNAVSELISIVGTVISFMILISLAGVINDISLIKVKEGEEITSTIQIVNSLTKILLIMAGTSVAKDSGDLLGNVFKGANDESGVLLEGIFNRLGAKDTAPATNSTQSAPRTRVITRTATSTKKVINFTESVPTSSTRESLNRDKGITVNNTNNTKSTFNANVTNNDNRINNIQNRANLTMDGASRANNTGVKSGNYKQSGDSGKLGVADILNKGMFNTYKQENDKLRNEWGFMKGNNSATSKEVVKNFESASKDLDSSISSGDQSRIRNSMNKYVEAYKKEEKVAKEGYRDFAGKSAKLSSDLTVRQQEELKKISTAYKKAQVEYDKTSRRLSQVSSGNMSTTDALRIKERADKQREKLMEASSKANDFYNNQKKGA